MTLTDAVLWASAAASGLSVIGTRRLTQLPLLGSLGLCLWLQMPFDLARYVTIDCVAIWLIVSLGMVRPLDRIDYAVVALFFVAWPFYLLPDPMRFWGGWAVVVTQFLVTVPWTAVWRRAIRTIPRDPWDMFDFRVWGAAH